MWYTASSIPRSGWHDLAPAPGHDDPLIGQALPDLGSAAELAGSAEGTRRFWRSFLSDRWAMAGLVSWW